MFVYSEELILAFCLSMLIGLLIGILIFILLTWISRHRASVRISTRPNQSSGAAGLRNLQGQLGSYRSNDFNLNSDSTSRAGLTLQRQTSVDPNELLGRSPSFQASTFRPPRKKGSDEKEDENQRALLHDTTAIDSVTDPYNMAQSESFWLGKGSLRGFLPTQTPPPAYDSVIHIFQETHTWFHMTVCALVLFCACTFMLVITAMFYVSAGWCLCFWSMRFSPILLCSSLTIDVPTNAGLIIIVYILLHANLIQTLCKYERIKSCNK